MDLTLTDEQQMLSDSIARYIADSYDFETRQKIAATEPGFSLDAWSDFADLGWTAIPFAEADGGLDGGPVELALLMEEFGRGLVLEPYLANIVLAGGVLRRAANDAQRANWLEPLIGGQLQAALAFAEPQARFDINDIATTAKAEGDHYVLNGTKNLVLNGGQAELLIIPARTNGSQNDREGITLFAVEAGLPGIERKAYPTVDGHQAAELTLQDVRLPADAMVSEPDGGLEILQDVVNEAILCVCAEGVGIIRSMHEKTVQYCKDRTQFGQPIGKFQALQHRLVDTLMACEQSRSLLMWSAMANASGSDEASRSIHALKYQLGTAGVQVSREALQLHGGMGMTWDLDIGHYFKRMTAISILFGDADYHLNRYMA